MTLEIRWETCAHATFATRSERYQWQLAHTRPGPDPGGTRPGPACRDRQMAGGRDPSRERAAVSGGFFDTHTSPIAPEARDAVKRLFIARTEVTPAAGEKLRKKDFFPPPEKKNSKGWVSNQSFLPNFVPETRFDDSERIHFRSPTFIFGHTFHFFCFRTFHLWQREAPFSALTAF